MPRLRHLPEIAEALGKSVRKFQSASHDLESEIRREAELPEPPDQDGE